MLTQKDFLFDKRLVERFISRGLVTRKAFNAHLEQLGDVTPKSQPLFGDDAKNVDSDKRPAVGDTP